MGFRRIWILSLIAIGFPAIALAQSSVAGRARSEPETLIPQTTAAINSATPLSERVVWYSIDAKYDPKTHQLDGSEVLTYRNLTGQPFSRFPFHLYLNGFQPKATWIREARAAGTRDTTYEKWKPEDLGSDDIQRFEVVGMGDLTASLHYIQPDDDNKDDKTVIEAVLPRAIASGESVQFKIKFHDQFPETQARTGWKRDFTLGGQWFPKVGVWWQGGWNCHQFHAFTEFFADFGVYDVKLTVPQNEVVGASGIEVSNVNNSDGTKTLTYHGDDIHDFAWTTSPRYRVADDSYAGAMGPVKLRLLMQPAHWSQEARHAQILKQSLEHFERWYGPYPYKTLTLVDPEPGSAAGGMEYPTFITGESSWFMPEGFHELEIVVEHEFGHQYWYGMVATNEFEDAWLDEGINSYTELKVLDDILGKDSSIFNIFGMNAGERDLQRSQFLGVDDLDPLTRKAWQYASFGSYGGITYGKTASVLLTLEGLIGEDTMQKAMRVYFMRYRFKHPNREDFLKTLEEVSGKDLRWYFNQAVYGTQLFDYEVRALGSRRTDWFVKDPKTNPADVEYESTVMLHRKSDFQFPVETEIRFDNGDKVREHWDGQERWVRFNYVKKAKVVSAELDPEHKIQIDRNDFNNSRTREPNSGATRKLANFWVFLTQALSQFLSWWVA